jgi:phage shock protein PspC (stress-responsive transcriptional regulator)
MMNNKSDTKKLYRSSQDRYLSGVAGGLGGYLGIDSNILRILFVIFTFFGGIGLVLYLLALFIVPENPFEEESVKKKAEKDRSFILALILILVGALLLFREFGFFHYFHYWRIPWVSIWAIFLIVIGVLIILSANKSTKKDTNPNNRGFQMPDINKIQRSKTDRIIAGVCAGIAEYFKIDPSIVRLLWVLASFASVGLGIIVYVILIFVFPEKLGKETQ